MNKTFLTAILALTSPLLAQEPSTLYVNPLTGSDTANDGQTEAAPYATIGKALAEIASGGGSIFLAPGTYPALNITSAPSFSGYVNIVSTTALAAVIRGVTIKLPSSDDAVIRFLDCQITKDGDAVTLENARRTQFLNCYVRTDRHSDAAAPANPLAPRAFAGFDLNLCEDIEIRGCWITNCGRGALFTNCDDITMYRCTIVVRQGTGISWENGNSNGLFQLLWVTEEDYLESTGPDWLSPDHAHQSGFSLRSDDLQIKQCLFTHVGGTSVIRMYPNSGIRYDDVVVENCAFIHNDGIYMSQFYNWGYGNRFTNCTFAGGQRTNAPASGLCYPFEDAEYKRYKTAVHIKSTNNIFGVPDSELKFQNCVLMGTMLNSGADMDGCIMWARGTGTVPAGVHDVTNWVVQQDQPGCSASTEMESGFFLHSGSWDFAATYHPITDWAVVPDLRLASTSRAINFGVVALQTTDSLPQVGADGRLELTWPTRSATHHDAGAYQH